MKISVVALLFWLICGYVNYGLTLGHYTHKYPDQAHLKYAISWSFIGGLIGLPIVLSDSPYHWRTTPLTTEERWAEFNKLFPALGREYFDTHR